MATTDEMVSRGTGVAPVSDFSDFSLEKDVTNRVIASDSGRLFGNGDWRDARDACPTLDGSGLRSVPPNTFNFQPSTANS
jgi:hypothetical protein